jgi:hypothetical protein
MTHRPVSQAKLRAGIAQIIKDAETQLEQNRRLCRTSMQFVEHLSTSARETLRRRVERLGDAPSTPLHAVAGFYDCIETNGLSAILLVAVVASDTEVLQHRVKFLLVPPLLDMQAFAADLGGRFAFRLLAEQLNEHPDKLYVFRSSVAEATQLPEKISHQMALYSHTASTAWLDTLQEVVAQSALLVDVQAVLQSTQVIMLPRPVAIDQQIWHLLQHVPRALETEILLWGQVLEPQEYITLDASSLEAGGLRGLKGGGLSSSEEDSHWMRKWRVSYLQAVPDAPPLCVEIAADQTEDRAVKLQAFFDSVRQSETPEPLSLLLANDICSKLSHTLPDLLGRLHRSFDSKEERVTVSTLLGGWRVS